MHFYSALDDVALCSLLKERILFLRGAGWPQSGKNIWKMKFFPGQGKVREFCGWSGKFRKKLGKSGKSQGI